MRIRAALLCRALHQCSIFSTDWTCLTNTFLYAFLILLTTWFVCRKLTKKNSSWYIILDICCLSADEKEEGILGSILLPSFHISMLSVDDHINRKYAFKVSAHFHSSSRSEYSSSTIESKASVFFKNSN